MKKPRQKTGLEKREAGLGETPPTQLIFGQLGIVCPACRFFLIQHAMDLIVRAIAKIVFEFTTVLCAHTALLE
jgi:hypothetical protein